MNKIIITKVAILVFAMVAFQGCSEDKKTDTPVTPDEVVAPTSYAFQSQFDNTQSSVSYNGQVVRNLLIRDIKGLAATSGTTSAQLVEYLDNSNATATITSQSYTADQTTYHEIGNSGKNLRGKLSTEQVIGFNQTPEQLMLAWFAEVEAGGSENTDGVKLDQMIAKGLLGAVSYYGACGYLGTIDDDATTQSGDNMYSEMEHHWDESFGYFGAARDYGTQTIAERKTNKDSDASGTIDYTSEANFDWAAYAAKRDDCTGCDTGGFGDAIFNAYVQGRHLITTGGSLADISVERTKISNNWEKVIAANIVHYANSVTSDIDANSSDLNKHWSEMRAFGMALQFNELSDNIISSTDLTSIVTSMGNVPPAANEQEAYKTTLASIKATLGTVYMFTDADLANF